MNIQMCDLKRQYQRIKGEVDAAIQEVIDSSAFIKGKEVGLFQDELASYLNVKHVIGCANGTDALQIALMALGLKPGDEVITPDFTFIATVEVVALLGLTPILVDVDPSTFTMDVRKLEEAITPNTKAIIPVHLFGQCANMDDIMRIAQKHNLYVVEDTAQALGADYYHADGKISKAGTIGTIGTTSFFPSKNLGCYGDGGALFTNDDELAAEIRSIANHGMKVRYHH
ncbi:MAG: UDP-2-acetamido-2-deoxy-ribo-hexuluronate aminotransferase, partial [Tenuifilum sp.]|uniref:DegT/DnrJ/EryC1/StrS family aminotransferase n=1 Tax=Tenuifilum sp. TaxID=2760880 RepID=UPI0024AB056A